MNAWTRREALVALGALGAGSAAAAVSEGDMAPDFTLESSQGGTEKLSSYRGNKNVVVAFFPKAFTGG